MTTAGAYLRPEDLTGPHPTLDADIIIIGSGAGGAPAAALLAEAGHSVLVLEQGIRRRTEDMSCDPQESSQALYGAMGLEASLGLPPIPIYYGRCLGGTTTINSGTCFRTPDPVIRSWQRISGLDLDPAALAPHFDQVARDLHIHAPELELIGRNGQILHEAREVLGVSGGVIERNARGCRQSGVCAFGCPTGAKQSTLVSYIPRAVAAGARVLTRCRAERFRLENGRIQGLEAELIEPSGPRPLSVTGRVVILAAGAMASPGMLARNGLGGPANGRHLTLHPALKINAIVDERFHPWEGVPQSYYIDEWHSEGFLIETIAVPPVIEAMSLPGSGRRHAALMELEGHLLSWGAMISDSGEGQIRRVAGRDQAFYQLHKKDTHKAGQALIRLAELAFAVGARGVIAPCHGAPIFRELGEVNKFVRRKLKASDLDLAAFHPLGSCRMGVDPASSVVDPDHKVHGVEGLYVIDGSVFPTSLSVNPQWTIMAFARRAAERLIETELGAARSAA